MGIGFAVLCLFVADLRADSVRVNDQEQQTFLTFAMALGRRDDLFRRGTVDKTFRFQAVGPVESGDERTVPLFPGDTDVREAWATTLLPVESTR